MVSKDGTGASQASRKDRLRAKTREWKEAIKDNKFVKEYIHDPQPILQDYQYFGMVSTRGKSQSTAWD
jgi:hypothetical protein